MKFHNYLEQLLGGRVAVSLVRTLLNYKGKVFTVRKLAEAAKVSSSEAAVVVQQLEKYGILQIQPVGKSYLIALNDKSYVLDRILKPMINAEQETLSELVSVLKKHLADERIIAAGLFGSITRGSEREDSDIDLLVISNDFEAASTLVSRAREEASIVFNSRLSPLIMSEKELAAKKDDKLVRSIVVNYIAVSGREINQVIGSK